MLKMYCLLYLSLHVFVSFTYKVNQKMSILVHNLILSLTIIKLVFEMLNHVEKDLKFVLSDQNFI